MRNYTESEVLLRQLDIIPLSILKQKIHIIGAGGLGSFITLALTKMGFKNITVWDYDTVSVHNLNAQFYRFCDIDKPKVAALKDICHQFANIDIDIKYQKVDLSELEGIVISAVDNMLTRKAVWEVANYKKYHDIDLVIDPRLGGEVASCYTGIPNTAMGENYQLTLHSDEESSELSCTAKSTMYIALLVAGHVSKVVKDFLTSPVIDHVNIMNWDIKNNVQDSYMLESGSTNPILKAQLNE